MFSVIFTFCFAVIVTGLGWSVVAWLDRKRILHGGEQLGASFLIGCIAASYGVSLIGPWRLDGVSMAILAGACILLAIPGLRSMPWCAFTKLAGSERTAMSRDKWLALLWVAAGAIGLGSVIQGLAPPNDYDSLLYHLSLPRYDLEMGYMSMPWDRNFFQILMPALGGNLSRLTLVLADDRAAQMIHGLSGLVAALGSAMLVIRLGYSRHVAILAAVFFLSIRAVIWEMASAETDVLFAAAAIFSVLMYLAWRNKAETGLAILFGIFVGMTILIKLQGFAFALAIAPLVVYDLIRDRKSGVVRGLVGPFVAFLVIMPHLVKTYMLTGNPLFPMFHSHFVAGAPDFMAGLSSVYGTGTGLIDFLTGPWFFSIQPMIHFDGMVLGAPYLLALCPLLILDPARRRWLVVLSIALVFYGLWFYLLSQQVRFLVQIAPILTAVAAVGAAALWRQTLGMTWLRWPIVFVLVVLALNQAMFVGVYAALRLPPALGLISDAAYHERTPTMTGAYYKTCSFVAENLKAGERYFSDTANFVSFYCPQAAVVRNYFPDEAKWWLGQESPPEMSRQEFIKRAETMNFQFFMTSEEVESRRNNTGKSIFSRPGSSRFEAYLHPAFEHLEPLIRGRFTAVYDGPAVIKVLKEIAD